MRSLRNQLARAISVSIAVAFLLVAFSAWRVVDGAVTRDFDARLSGALGELSSGIDRDAAGILSLAVTPGDPAFSRLQSGWYWTISDGNEIVARSRSLLFGAVPAALALPANVASDGERRGTVANEEALRVQRRTISLRGGGNELVAAVAGPEQAIANEVWQSMRWLLVALLIIVVALIAAIAFEMQRGLAPLGKLAHDVERAAGGEVLQLSESGYREIDPLVRGINDLVGQVTQVVERARAQAGNLAHALKTPLSLISARNESREADRDEDIRLSVETMRRQIDHHLKRARFAGKVRLASERIVVGEVVDDILLVMKRTYRVRGLSITVDVPAGIVFVGEREDLEEMIGNLADNACKWASAAVTIKVLVDAGVLSMRVEDDGAGLSADDQKRVLERGRRLDESVAGSGLGLSIVADLVDLYGGTLELSQSSLGGLRATISLTAASS